MNGLHDRLLEKMGEQTAYWGAVGAVYAGVECEVSRIRGTRDWKTAMIGGALTGLTISAAGNNSRDRVVLDAITGGAIAAAAEFLNNMT
ncbi:outer envelope pore protein 16, chloroplastic-like [Syzygium oleosum]|uniref:outer envelope pore protein 16, chloroplastic-like n=1 Tax=Syzygium oleosum TaxID=219896 RepID=UPI0024BB0DEE|nr:outer envelope pore protein 16, chloroplastic-like [Syzygium oleosum]